MLGLFGTLNLGTRSLQTQQTGVEVTGQNLANVNNPAYARQRVQIQTSVAIPSALGPEGTGAEAVGIEQLRDLLLDAQIRNEQSVGGYWTAQQNALQNAQVSLNEFLDRSGSTINGTTSTGSAGSLGLSDALTGFFSAFQDLATSPESTTSRQEVITQSQTLTTRFHEVAQRLDEFQDTLNASISSDVASANTLLSDIAKLNDLIAKSELPMGGKANDLRDLREQKLEELAKLTNFEASAGADGTIGISINGNALVSGNQVVDTLETYSGTRGQLYVRTAQSQVGLSLTGGSLAGTINVQDGELLTLQTNLDTLATALMDQVNAIHSNGYSLTGSTGQNFFGGTGAADIYINPSFVSDPRMIQASGSANTPGDNSVALALAQLRDQASASLNGQTFGEYYTTTVSVFGQALSTANTQVSNHEVVNDALLKQRDSVSGVSIDEEMTNLLTYQKAYQASAKIVTTVDEMLDTILSMKR